MGLIDTDSCSQILLGGFGAVASSVYVANQIKMCPVRTSDYNVGSHSVPPYISLHFACILTGVLDEREELG